MSLDVPALLNRGSVLGGEPDVNAIERLARRRVVNTRFAGLTMAVVVGVGAWFSWQQFSSIPSDTSRMNETGPTEVTQSPDEELTAHERGLAAPQERAATVALGALNKAGLQDPEEKYFDYAATTRSSGGWIAHFCSERQSRCDSDNSDAQLEVQIDGDDMVIVRAKGTLHPLSAQLVGYREQADPPIPSNVYAEIEETGDVEEYAQIQATLYWTGAIPSGLVATCKVQAVDEGGLVVYEGREIPKVGPVVEGARDSLFITGIPHGKATGNYRVECGPFTPKPSRDPRESNQPETEGEVIATYTSPEPEGRTFEVRAWDEPDMWCWALHPQGEEHRPSHCNPRAQPLDDALQVWGFTEAETGRYAYAWGELTENVARVELRFDSGETLMPEIIDPPEDMAIPTRFFVVFVEEFRSGEIVVLDAEGEVLQVQDYRAF
jgi:hypothetical protein